MTPTTVENKINKLNDNEIRLLMVRAVEQVISRVRIHSENLLLIEAGISATKAFLENEDWEKMNNCRKYLQWQSQETKGYEKFALYAAEKMSSCGAPKQRLGNVTFSNSRQDLETAAKLCLGYCCALVYGHYEEGYTHWSNPWDFCEPESVEKILSI